MPPDVLTGEDLVRLASKLGLGAEFKGVNLVSDLPKRIPVGGGIINFLGGHHRQVGHWVCWINRPDWPVVMYFDPYGAPPPDKILAFLQSSGKPIWWTDDQYQNWGSNRCGWFCLYVLRHGLQPTSTILNVTGGLVPRPGPKNETLVKR